MVNLAESVEGEINHGHTVTVGEGSNQVSPGQADPVNCHVTWGTYQELGLSNATPAQSDGFEGESDRVQAN